MFLFLKSKQAKFIPSKDTSLFVAYADASVDDMKLVEIVSKNYLSLSTLFGDNHAHKLLIIDGCKGKQVTSTINKREIFKNGMSARLYSIFSRGLPDLEVTRLFWRKKAIQEQIPINQLKSNTKHVTLKAHDVISSHFAIFKKYEPKDIDYVIRDALMKTDKILKFSSELQIIRFVQSALARFCKIYRSTGDNAASLSFEFAGDKINPEIVIERSFIFYEKNERDFDEIRVTKKLN